MERTGTHLGVVRLHDDATLLAPIALERKDDVLEGTNARVHALPTLLVSDE